MLVDRPPSPLCDLDLTLPPNICSFSNVPRHTFAKDYSRAAYVRARFVPGQGMSTPNSEPAHNLFYRMSKGEPGRDPMADPAVRHG